MHLPTFVIETKRFETDCCTGDHTEKERQRALINHSLRVDGALNSSSIISLVCDNARTRPPGSNMGTGVSRIGGKSDIKRELQMSEMSPTGLCPIFRATGGLFGS